MPQNQRCLLLLLPSKRCGRVDPPVRERKRRSAERPMVPGFGPSHRVLTSNTAQSQPPKREIAPKSCVYLRPVYLFNCEVYQRIVWVKNDTPLVSFGQHLEQSLFWFGPNGKEPCEGDFAISSPILPSGCRQSRVTLGTVHSGFRGFQESSTWGLQSWHLSC